MLESEHPSALLMAWRGARPVTVGSTIGRCCPFNTFASICYTFGIEGLYLLCVSQFCASLWLPLVLVINMYVC